MKTKHILLGIPFHRLNKTMKRITKITKNKKHDWPTILNFIAILVSAIATIVATYSTCISRNQYALSVKQFDAQHRKDSLDEIEDKIKNEQDRREFQENIGLIKAQVNLLKDENKIMRESSEGRLSFKDAYFSILDREYLIREGLDFKNLGYTPDVYYLFDKKNNKMDYASISMLTLMTKDKNFYWGDRTYESLGKIDEAISPQTRYRDSLKIFRHYSITASFVNYGKLPVILNEYKVWVKWEDSETFFLASKSDSFNNVVRPDGEVAMVLNLTRNLNEKICPFEIRVECFIKKNKEALKHFFLLKWREGLWYKVDETLRK